MGTQVREIMNTVGRDSSHLPSTPLQCTSFLCSTNMARLHAVEKASCLFHNYSMLLLLLTGIVNVTVNMYNYFIIKQ